MLLTYGEQTVDKDWGVTEPMPTAFARVYYVRDGEAVFTSHNKEIKLKHNTIYVLPTITAYSVKHNPQKPLRCLYVHLDMSPNIIKEVIEIELKNENFLLNLFNCISIAISQNNQYIIMMLCNIFIEHCFRNNYFTKLELPIAKTLEYISENLTEKISLKTLSNVCGYNEQYFLRLFKKTIGITPHKYILNQRIKEAIKLMNSQKNLSVIAREVGFLDVKSFSRAFKQKYGYAPSKFIKITP